MNAREAYEALIEHARKLSVLSSCAGVLGWDEQTYMPHNGAAHRGEQMALLAGLQHERATDPRIGEWLGAIDGSDLVRDPDSPAAANVRELRRRFDRQTRLPRSLVESLARAAALGHRAWVDARRTNDFPAFRPHIETMVDLKRQEAACLAPGGPAYDALLDDYEPGATAAELKGLFDGLKQALVPLVQAIAGSSRQPDESLLARSYPIDRQRVLGEMAAESIGFDFRSGRLDVAAHPFCTGLGPGDCRITTRYDEHAFSQAFFGVLHEVGHGLYEQGLDPEHAGTPMGEAASLGVHESQSRLWENAVGRGRPFWEYWFPVTRRLFREALHDVALDDFHRAVNCVRPSLIRVEADEVTYNLHILVRFELEQALLSGDLAAADLPGAWNAAYEAALGLKPATDAEGCLQDVHWSEGLFGYFPTYTLGNVYGAQLLERARSELGDLDAAVARGNTTPLLAWLRRNVHARGMQLRPTRLIETVTGQPPTAKPLIDALRSKYGELYALGGAA